MERSKKVAQRTDRNKLIEAVEKLRIEELDGIIPLIGDGAINVDDTFIWYQLNNAADFEKLQAAYSKGVFAPPKNYPTPICLGVPGIDLDLYEENACGYYLDQCLEDARYFWGKLGYKVTIEKLDK